MKVIAWSQNLTPERCAEGRRRVRQQGRTVRAVGFSLHPPDAERAHARHRRRGRSRPHEADRVSRQHIARPADRRERADRGADAKRIAGAGLDVYDIEPLPVTHAYRKLDNVIATPHLGYVTEVNYRKFFEDTVEDIRAFLDGKPVRLVLKNK